MKGARLVWYPATAGTEDGIVFQVQAHGARHYLHFSAWARGHDVRALDSQQVVLTSPGPDTALDSRLFSEATIRFGRVTDHRVVLSFDGRVEALDLDAKGLSAVEADIRCGIEPAAARHHCVGCSAELEPHTTLAQEIVGGVRVRRRVVPLRCPTCVAQAVTVRHCPVCAAPYAEGRVLTMATDDDRVRFSATCPAGHQSAAVL